MEKQNEGKIYTIAVTIGVLGVITLPAMAGTNVYLPMGDAGEVLILDTYKDTTIGRISDLPAVHGLAGTPGWGFLVAGSYDERPVGETDAPPKPRGVSQKDHEVHHTKRPEKAAAPKDTVSFLSIVRIADGVITRRIEVPGAVHHTAVVPGGRFAISTHLDLDSVSIVDIPAGKVAAVVRTGPSPNYAVVSPDGKRVYVSNAGNNTVSDIDAEHWTVQRNIPVGEEPEHLVMSSDGKALFVANVESGSVSAISLPEGSVMDTFKVGGELHGLDLSDDGKTLFVSGRGKDTLTAIDLSTKKTRRNTLSPAPYHLTSVPGTGKLYVSSSAEDKLWVVDQKSLSVIREVLIPGQGHQMVVMDN